MKLDLTIDEVLSTTRSVRKRLDFDRPVEREIVEDCLNLALQAPTGGNNQGWHWIVVEDAAKRKALADIYKANFKVYASMPGRKFAEGDQRIDQMPKVRDSAMYLADEFHRAPMMLIPCIEGRLENIDVAMGAGAWGSLLPGVWSFMLALRSRGLGSAWTTIHLILEGEKKAAEILGIPFEKSHKVDSFQLPTQSAPTSSQQNDCHLKKFCTGISGRES